MGWEEALVVLMVGGGEERVYLVYKPGAGEEEGEGRRSTGIVFLGTGG